MVIEADPIPDDTAGVLQAFESMTVYALVFQRSDDPLNHAILLGTVWRDEFLLQSIAFDQSGVATAGEDQSVVRPKKKRFLYPTEMPVSSNQSLFQGRLCRLGAAAAAQVPAQQFAGVTIHHQRQAGPTITASPHPAQVCGPTLIRRRGHH